MAVFCEDARGDTQQGGFARRHRGRRIAVTLDPILDDRVVDDAHGVSVRNVGFRHRAAVGALARDADADGTVAVVAVGGDAVANRVAHQPELGAEGEERLRFEERAAGLHHQGAEFGVAGLTRGERRPWCRALRLPAGAPPRGFV
jgi:hypothetical protein